MVLTKQSAQIRPYKMLEVWYTIDNRGRAIKAVNHRYYCNYSEKSESYVGGGRYGKSNNYFYEVKNYNLHKKITAQLPTVTVIF